ncbi:polyphosphate polymerase domain-containing protein [Mangrovibacterium diazotrophicum]|uniref:VTC domain-containing protein n=1 Tax=Mangrovibacterium diazotrophicum TaxID=1261403 RepID=A0A419W5I4_9BACT|nr:polyphosphate polymerase domain-containing protein [Mangrovibacterium diazotrophicum]RKD90731.1 VTC domain-containing protein [Mangrovibacterium diazotrophicum]
MEILTDIPSGLGARTQSMRSIPFENLDPETQMIRFDTKYVFPLKRLDRILELIDHRYAVVDFYGTRVSAYESQYFDTAEWTFYNAHHNGAANRCKIRTRTYTDTGLSFLEVKLKNNKKLTTKKRKMLNPELGMLEQGEGFISSHTSVDLKVLRSTLYTTYRRISLVNLRKQERITIDYDLKFCFGGSEVSLPELAIAETKNDNQNQQTVFARLMRNERIRPQAFSKYCVGVALLHPCVKTNNFKELIRELNPQYL